MWSLCILAVQCAPWQSAESRRWRRKTTIREGAFFTWRRCGRSWGTEAPASASGIASPLGVGPGGSDTVSLRLMMERASAPHVMSITAWPSPRWRGERGFCEDPDDVRRSAVRAPGVLPAMQGSEGWPHGKIQGSGARFRKPTCRPAQQFARGHHLRKCPRTPIGGMDRRHGLAGCSLRPSIGPPPSRAPALPPPGALFLSQLSSAPSSAR